ncbi:MAG TPA: hypothetical protein VFY15_07535 [Acidimicrobiia bacterium]|nr:hypothetical protein [Acidimicrobiia bacterium]
MARAEAVPEELDAGAARPFVMPSTRRRRIAGWILLGAATLELGIVAIGGARGLLVMAGFLVAAGAWCLMAAWPIRVEDHAALAAAGARIGFPVGHASAMVGFKGWRSRPVWNVLLFSADEPPTRRALVMVDAVSGQVLGEYEEELTADS